MYPCLWSHKQVWLDQAVLTPGKYTHLTRSRDTNLYRTHCRCYLFSAAVVFFFSSMTFLEGKGVGEAKRRLDAAYVPTLIRNW